MSDQHISDTHALVDALGGREAVADLLQCQPNYVSMWHVRGIPPGYYLPLFLECGRRGLRVDPAVFDMPSDAFDRIVFMPAVKASPVRPIRLRRRRMRASA